MYDDWTDGPLVETTLFEHIIARRDITDPQAFLGLKWPDSLHDPFLMPDMKKAVARIGQALEKKEKIALVGDYDMDGTPGAALLSDFLTRCGTVPMVIIPTRDEGYGFAPAFVDRAHKAGVTLMITIDCGIRDTEAVQKAKELGIDVIITDHHECPDELPPAFAIVNPKRPGSKYPFDGLSGTAVAFKMCQALIDGLPQKLTKDVPKEWLAWSLDLVAISTIADMMHLVDENRLFVVYGLKVLRKTARIGLQRFIDALGLELAKVTYQDIAFKISPKCKAPGRMESMDSVFTMLTTQNEAEADAAIKQILVYNTQSQLLLADMEAQATEKIKDTADANIILLADERWHHGLTSIVAGKLCEKYKKPVGILAPHDATLYRGSFRSPSDINITAVLTALPDLIDRCGGHAQAAGLSVAVDKIEPLRQLLATYDLQSVRLKQEMPTTDGTLLLPQTELAFLEELEQLSPWGFGHTEPVWSLPGVTLEDITWLKDGVHLKAKVRNQNSFLTVLLFNAEPHKPVVGEVLDICGTLSINEFRDKREPQLIIRGIRLARLI